MTEFRRVLFRSVYRDIDQKRSTTRYLHAAPVLVDPVPEIEK